MEKKDEIKDLYKDTPIRMEYFPIRFMAFIWIDAYENKLEIWVLYFKPLSKVTPNTLILSEDGIVFPSTGGLPNLSREMHWNQWNLSGFASI